MRYKAVKCSKCREVGFAVLEDSGADKVSYNILCLYCYNNLAFEDQVP